MSAYDDIAKATHVFVAFEACGCWSAVCTDLGFCGGRLAKETGSDVAGFIRSGRRVERIALKQWRKSPFRSITKCPHTRTFPPQIPLESPPG